VPDTLGSLAAPPEPLDALPGTPPNVDHPLRALRVVEQHLGNIRELIAGGPRAGPDFAGLTKPRRGRLYFSNHGVSLGLPAALLPRADIVMGFPRPSMTYVKNGGSFCGTRDP